MLKKEDKLMLVIVMPTYNEEAVIEEVFMAWKELLDKYFPQQNTKILIVNDGSKDRTGQILDELAVKYPILEVVHQVNGGHGAAVVKGYTEAINKFSPSYIFQTDSDDQ